MKHPCTGRTVRCPGEDVADRHSLDRVCSHDVFYDGVQQKTDLLVLVGTPLHDLARAQGVAPVDDRDMRGEARQIRSLLPWRYPHHPPRPDRVF